jgi:hypothetical protein
LAGQNTQGENSVSIGNSAGGNTQGSGAIAIGFSAGITGQGIDSIAIGNYSGRTNQPNNSISINATGTDVLPPAVSSLCVAPIRALAAATAMYYNSTTFEISYLTSTRDTKTNISELQVDTSAVYNLQPKSYMYKSCPESGDQIGYIADEAAAAHELFVTYDGPRNNESSKMLGIDYNVITVFLVEENKKLKNIVYEMNERIKKLEFGETAPPVES